MFFLPGLVFLLINPPKFFSIENYKISELLQKGMGLENFLKVGKRILQAGIISSVLYGCEMCSDIPIPEPEPPIELYKDTRILTQTETDMIGYVDEDSFSVPNTFSYRVGQIVVSGIGREVPDGLLRRVTSLTGVVVHTESATLDEAIENGEFEFTSSLSSAQAEFFPSRRGVYQIKSINPKEFHLYFDEVLYDIDNNDATTDDQVVIEGSLIFTVDTLLRAKIKNLSLDEFKFQVTADETSNLELRLLQNSGEINYEKIILGYYNIPSFTMGFIPTVPPLPLVIKPIVKLIAGIDGHITPVVTNIGNELELNLGLAYENSDWRIIKFFSNDFYFNPPQVPQEIDIKAYMRPELSFLLYGVAGLQIGIEGYLKLTKDINSWELRGGLEGLLGVEVSVLGRNLVDYNTSINILDERITGGEIEEPDPPVEPEPVEKILFVSIRNSNAGIFTISSTGSNLKTVLDSSKWENYPSWSPDGTQILYTSKTAFSNETDEIWIMNSDGTNRVQLTFWSNSANPKFSPDGTQIAYQKGEDGLLYIMNSDGSDQRKISDYRDSLSRGFSWHPQENEIVFVSDEYDNNRDIYVVNLDTSKIRRITFTPESESHPEWSPDGEIIIFDSDITGDYEIYRMNVDGSKKINVSDSPTTRDVNPSFSSDGTKIVYESYSNIWMMNVDGTNKKRVTNNYNNGHPSFQPHQ